MIKFFTFVFTLNTLVKGTILWKQKLKKLIPQQPILKQ